MTIGTLCWMGISFNVMVILVLPLLLGLGVDDGLHVVHRMMEDEELPADKATSSVVRAITMTTLTTCTSFGVLLMTNHAGMELMAQTMLIGLPFCLFASLTLVPALSVVLGLRKAS